MNSILISLIACACVFGAALLGMFLRATLPDTHLNHEILFDKIQELSLQTNIQHALQAQASNMAVDIGKMRWMMFEQGATPSACHCW